METKLLVVFLGLATLCLASENAKEKRSLTEFADMCSPGSWCDKTRGLTERESNTQSIGERASIAKAADNCPPGLWCGKKRGLNQQELSKKDRMSMTKFSKDCPPGLWCGKKRQVQEDRFVSTPFERPQSKIPNTQNQNPEVEEINPQVNANNVFPENLKQGNIDEKLFRRFEDGCPPGLWCGKKRSTSKKLAKRFSTICPPGLWCGK